LLPRRATDKFLQFATQSESLVGSATAPCDVGALQRRLRVLLADYRWSRAPSLIHTAALVDAFGKHPAIRPLMTAINLAWSDQQLATAVNRLLYRETVSKHPLMILMVLRLAGASLSDLAGAGVDASPDYPPKPRVARPKVAVRYDFPCGNPACERFHGYLPEALPAEKAGALPVRAVCPSCAYAYLRDPRRPGGVCVAKTGPLWDDLLARTLSGDSKGIRAASRALGVGPITVMRHARRLGLWREEWTDRPKVQLRQQTAGDRLLARHRAGWIEFRTSGEAVRAKEMPKAAFNAYRYLIRKDREWLERNHPLSRPSRGTR
jgi:hypothetical protein